VTVLSIHSRPTIAQATLPTAQQVEQESTFYRWLFARKVWRAARALTPVQRKMLCFIAQARGSCTPFNGYGLSCIWHLQDALLIEWTSGIRGGYIVTPFGAQVARMCQEGIVNAR
jgi:hypothetical protein